MKKILFVCTGNSCRSVMAEGLFRKMIAHRADEFYVHSAGIGAMDGYPSTSETIRVMKDEGVDVSDHRTQKLTNEMIDAADKIFVMEPIHKAWILNASPQAAKKIFMMMEFASPSSHGRHDAEIPDPIRMPANFYKNVLATIKDCVANIVKQVS